MHRTNPTAQLRWAQLLWAALLFVAVLAVIVLAWVATARLGDPRGEALAGESPGHDPEPEALAEFPPDDPKALVENSESVYFGEVLFENTVVDYPGTEPGTLQVKRFQVSVSEVLKTKTDGTADQKVEVGETVSVRRITGIVSDNNIEVGDKLLLFTAYSSFNNYPGHYEEVEPQGDQEYAALSEYDALKATYQNPGDYAPPTDPGVAQGVESTPEETTTEEPGAGDSGGVFEPASPTEESDGYYREYCPSDQPSGCTPPDE